MYLSRKSERQVRDELHRINELQRAWNNLSLAEKISVAKLSPDLSEFFRVEMAPRNAMEGRPQK